MNIESLVQSDKRLVVEQELPEVREEIKHLIKDKDYSFYFLGPLDEHQFYDFSNSQLYKRLDDNRVEKIDFTGEIFFGDVFFLQGDKDLAIIYKATFIEGLLKKIEIHYQESFDNQERKDQFTAALKMISRKQKLEKKLIYKYFLKYYFGAVFFFFFAVRSILLFIFQVLDDSLGHLQRFLSRR